MSGSERAWTLKLSAFFWNQFVFEAFGGVVIPELDGGRQPWARES